MKQGSWARWSPGPLPLSYSPPFHAGLGRAEKGAGGEGQGSEGAEAWDERLAKTACLDMILGGVVSINWQGEEEINL